MEKMVEITEFIAEKAVGDDFMAIFWYMNEWIEDFQLQVSYNFHTRDTYFYL